MPILNWLNKEQAVKTAKQSAYRLLEEVPEHVMVIRKRKIGVQVSCPLGFLNVGMLELTLFPTISHSAVNLNLLTRAFFCTF